MNSELERWVCIFVIVLVFHFTASPQQGGLDYAGMQACGIHHVNIASVPGNPASVAAIQSLSAFVYAEKKFMLSELGQYCLVVALKAGKGNGIALIGKYSGDKNLNASSLEVSFGKDLGKLRIGIAVGYEQMTVSGYGTEGGLIARVGSIWQINSRVITGFYFSNPQYLLSRQNYENNLPLYQFGIGYESSLPVLLTAGICKRKNAPLNFQAAISYNYSNRFFLGVGLLGNYATPFFSAGWKWNQVRLDITIGYHSQLGFSPATCLLFETKPNNQSDAE
jgi:hypothetical protein